MQSQIVAYLPVECHLFRLRGRRSEGALWQWFMQRRTIDPSLAKPSRCFNILFRRVIIIPNQLYSASKTTAVYVNTSRIALLRINRARANKLPLLSSLEKQHGSHLLGLFANIKHCILVLITGVGSRVGEITIILETSTNFDANCEGWVLPFM